MTLLETPPVTPEPVLVARARQLTGATTDADDINLALQRLTDDIEPVTPEQLIRKCGLLVVPGAPGHVLTAQMVEDALAESY